MSGYHRLMSLVSKKQFFEERIRTQEEKIERIKNNATGLSGSPLTGMPHAPSGEQDKLGTAVIDYIDLEERAQFSEDDNEIARINEELRRLIEENIIDYLACTVMYFRYVSGYSLPEVAELLEETLRDVERAHDQGIADLEQTVIYR